MVCDINVRNAWFYGMYTRTKWEWAVYFFNEIKVKIYMLILYKVNVGEADQMEKRTIEKNYLIK